MNLRGWISTEHDGVRARFERGVAPHVPRDRWRDRAGDGGSSIGFLLLHTSWHEDLAMQVAVGGAAPLLEEWRRPLGIGGRPASTGLGEAEDPAVTATLDVDALVAYASAVHDATEDWLRRADLDGLDAVPASSTRIATLAGVTETEVPWLHAMWSGQPVGWFLQWEAVGHRQNHLGEMIGVRSRLGLSPF
jgi:hypothetical protein